MSATGPKTASDRFVNVLGDRRGAEATGLFAAKPTAETRRQHTQLLKGLADGKPEPVFEALAAHPQLIGVRPLASALFDALVDTLTERCVELRNNHARLLFNATSVRGQLAEELIAGGWPRRLHIWPEGPRTGISHLCDLPSADVTTFCGVPVWSCERVPRGSWQRRVEDQCARCSWKAREYADCAEDADYPALADERAQQLTAAVRAAIAEAASAQLRMEQPQLGAVTNAGSRAHQAACLDIVCDATIGSALVYERVLGSERLGQMRWELTRAGIDTAVEDILGREQVLNLLANDDNTSTAFEWGMRVAERVLSDAGVLKLYSTGEVPRPSWHRR